MYGLCPEASRPGHVFNEKVYGEIRKHYRCRNQRFLYLGANSQNELHSIFYTFGFKSMKNTFIILPFFSLHFNTTQRFWPILALTRARLSTAHPPIVPLASSTLISEVRTLLPFIFIVISSIFQDLVLSIFQQS